MRYSDCKLDAFIKSKVFGRKPSFGSFRSFGRHNYLSIYPGSMPIIACASESRVFYYWTMKMWLYFS